MNLFLLMDKTEPVLGPEGYGQFSQGFVRYPAEKLTGSGEVERHPFLMAEQFEEARLYPGQAGRCDLLAK